MKEPSPHPKRPRIGHEGGCFKQGHASRSEAIKHLVHERRRGGPRMHTYFCLDCNAWHITKMGT